VRRQEGDFAVQPTDVTRRQFVVGAAVLVSATVGRSQTRQLTAQQVADRIRSNIGSAWRDKTVDGFKAGDPGIIVTGIATTVMATLDVLRRAIAAGQNFIITQEPVFYSANDEPGNRITDSVHLAKKAFIDQQGLVVWRFSDHWSARESKDAATALARTLGWADSRESGAEPIYQIPETTLGALAGYVGKRLGTRGGLRMVGQPGMPVRSVFVTAGGATVAGTIGSLRRADVILTGEPREWEVVPYVLDTGSTTRRKGMIAVGRIVSESPGMEACAAWIRTLVPEARVEVLAMPDPYWSPRS
jgi:putative NIF3 family GTP cyclohydrolase 1 type 2